MGYEPYFDSAAAMESTVACLNDHALRDGLTYALTVGTTSASVEVAPGLYRVFLAGLDASKTVSLLVGDSAVEAEAATGGGVSSVSFPGSAMERVRVPPGTRVRPASGLSEEIPLAAQRYSLSVSSLRIDRQRGAFMDSRWGRRQRHSGWWSRSAPAT